MREIKGSSGAHIIINAAPFAVVKRLRRCFAEEFRRISIDIGNPGSLAEIKEEFGNNVSIGDRVNLAGNVYIGDNVSIGSDSILQTIGHKIYYKGRQLDFHKDGYPVEINTTSFIEVKDGIRIADGTKVLPSVILNRDTETDELVLK